MSHARPYVAAAALAISIQACGGAAAPPSPSAPASAQDLGTPEGALAAVDQAERAIDRLLGGSVSVTVGQSASQALPLSPPPQASAAPAAPPAGGQAAKGGRGVSESRHEEPVAADACSNACSSLASMERAAGHLCGLTGEDDGRCASARTRVKSAAARVHAACPACS